MRRVLVLLLLTICGQGAVSAQTESFDQKFDAFLNSFVSGGHVDYARIKRHPEGLNALVDSIETIDFERLEPDNEEAFLINAYNALVIAAVVQHYPLHSPLDVEGFFRAEKHVVGGKSMTLDQLEKEVILKKFPDPRLHFALVCAARGCPRLRDDPYRGKVLNQDLEDHVSIAMMSPSLVHVDAEMGTVYLSQLFEWYKTDFTQGGQSLIDFVNHYRATSVPSDYRVAYIPYDWALNDKNTDE